MTLVATTLRDMRGEISDYLQEVLELLPKAARFLWLVTQALLAIVLAPIYGVFGFSLYLWGEAGWSEKLSLPQRVLFWTIVLPLSGAQWYITVIMMGSFGFLP